MDDKAEAQDRVAQQASLRERVSLCLLTALLAALLPRSLLLHPPLLLAIYCGRDPALHLLHSARRLLRGQGLHQPQPHSLCLRLHHLRPAQGPGELASLCAAWNQAHWGVDVLWEPWSPGAALLVTEAQLRVWAPHQPPWVRALALTSTHEVSWGEGL